MRCAADLSWSARAGFAALLVRFGRARALLPAGFAEACFCHAVVSRGVQWSGKVGVVRSAWVRFAIAGFGAGWLRSGSLGFILRWSGVLRMGTVRFGR